VLFGSDYPLDGPLQAAENVTRLGFTDSELAAIMHDNAAELLTP
jgi:predicted TIM-barrel fold metal-dependent hydrolase